MIKVKGMHYVNECLHDSRNTDLCFIRSDLSDAADS